MKKYLVRMRTDLYERIKIMSKLFGLSMNKTIIKLLEIGYLTTIKEDNWQVANHK